jgi:Flp pilus assembly protein TadB
MRTPAGAATLDDETPSGTPRLGQGKEGHIMPTWLIILIVGVVLLVFGVAVEAAKFLIWLGIIVLVVSLIMGLVGRGRARV